VRHPSSAGDRSPGSLGTQGDERVDLRCPPRGNVRGDERDREQLSGNQRVRADISQRDAVEEAPDGLRQCERHRETDGRGDQRQRQALAHDERDHIASVSAHRHPDANLHRASRDRVDNQTIEADARQRERQQRQRHERRRLDASSTAIVRKKDAVRWWTFGGFYANAASASRLKAEGGYLVAPNNLAIKIAREPSDSAILSAIHTIRALDAETLVPEVTTKALEGLKFSACLPPELATRVLQRRMADSDAVRRVLSQPVQLVARP
jgi:hypothetical protein